MAIERFTWATEKGAEGDVTQRVRSKQFGDGYEQSVADDPTDDPALDQCKGCLSSCKLRFGENNELSFGGFPAVSLIARS